MIVFFEVLYLNGEIIIREPYINRRKTLEAMIKTRKALVSPPGRFLTSDRQS